MSELSIINYHMPRIGMSERVRGTGKFWHWQWTVSVCQYGWCSLWSTICAVRRVNSRQWQWTVSVWQYKWCSDHTMTMCCKTCEQSTMTLESECVAVWMVQWSHNDHVQWVWVDNIDHGIGERVCGSMDGAVITQWPCAVRVGGQCRQWQCTWTVIDNSHGQWVCGSMNGAVIDVL